MEEQEIGEELDFDALFECIGDIIIEFEGKRYLIVEEDEDPCTITKKKSEEKEKIYGNKD